MFGDLLGPGVPGGFDSAFRSAARGAMVTAALKWGTLALLVVLTYLLAARYMAAHPGGA
jgi:hypothetical protein